MARVFSMWWKGVKVFDIISSLRPSVCSGVVALHRAGCVVVGIVFQSIQGAVLLARTEHGIVEGQVLYSSLDCVFCICAASCSHHVNGLSHVNIMKVLRPSPK